MRQKDDGAITDTYIPRIIAAGSLKHAFTTTSGIFDAFQPKPCFDFGASGTMSKRIETGMLWDLFCSANASHPSRLHTAGLASPSRVFATNSLALLLRRRTLDSATRDPVALLYTPELRIGMSTPVADPSGDYALQLFDRLANLDPDRDADLRRRVRIVTGGGEKIPTVHPDGVYVGVLQQGTVDLMLAYRTICQEACSKAPDLTYLTFPPEIEVGARFAAAFNTARPELGASLLQYLVGPEAQARLAVFGFGPPD
ncbi:MAG: substrate-binding domain-containing protein [Alphaproteobacteria bacterium]|nr:substrate-binding domain-containing protein [Alphaproteobacteria bacterium]